MKTTSNFVPIFLIASVLALPASCAAYADTAKGESPAKQVEEFGDTPLMTAAYHGDIRAMQELLDKGADVNEHNALGATALYFAAGATPTTPQQYKGSIDAVRLLLDRGADIDARGKVGITPLMTAIGSRNDETSRLLIVRGADVNISNKYGDTALMEALDTHQWALARLLLDHHADIHAPADVNGEDVLIHAVNVLRPPYHEGFLSSLMWLLHPTAETNDLAEGTNVVKLLLDKGARPDRSINGGFSAFTLAAMECHELLMQSFLDHDVDVNYKDGNGTTALMEASGCPGTSLIQMLLDRGADVNAKSKFGRTALMQAALYDRPWIAKLLLDHQADAGVKDGSGITALDLAKRSHATEIIELLNHRGTP